MQNVYVRHNAKIHDILCLLSLTIYVILQRLKDYINFSSHAFSRPNASIHDLFSPVEGLHEHESLQEVQGIPIKPTRFNWKGKKGSPL